MADDTEHLVCLSQRGDRAAFEELIARFQKQVFYVALRVVGDRHLADDVTQEVFIKTYRALPGLQDPAYFKTWLLRITMNRAIDYKRRATREREQVFLFDDEPVGVGTEAPEMNRADVTELGKALQDAIESLPGKMQKVMLLSLNGELSQEEAARILDCPVGTVKSRLFHARRLLREKLRQYL